MVLPHLRSMACCAKLCCSGVPMVHSTWAKLGPPEYIQTAGLAPRISSATDQASVRGAAIAAEFGRQVQAEPLGVHERAEGLLEASGIVTVAVAGSNTGGCRSASAKDSAIGPVASRFTSSRMPRAVSSSTSG